jgi:hypothetical protein
VKAKLLFIVAASCAALGANAQSLPKPTVPTPAPLAPQATAPVATKSAIPPGVPTPVAASPAPTENAGPRNPLMRPAAPAPQPTPTPLPVAQAPNKLGPPGLPGLPGMQNASDDLDVDPIKATGKRIGRINGSDIYKHEDAYYFDAPAKPKK